MLGYQLIVIVWAAISLILAAIVGRRGQYDYGAPAIRKILCLAALHWLLSVAVFSLTAFLMGETFSMRIIGVVLGLSTGLSLTVLAAHEHFSKPLVLDNDEDM